MASGYKPLYIAGMTTGLVQERQEFILPNDAYPRLENAYVWREKIKRKDGYELLGRLRRLLVGVSIGITGISPWTFNIFAVAVPAITEANAALEAVSITFGGITFTDNGDGTLTGSVAGNSGVINYATGSITLTHTAGAGVPATANINYFPNLPVMGLRSRELTSINNEELVAFDQKYAYVFSGTGFEEFIPGTTWSGNDSDFFWSTNYWTTGATNNRLFWVTNFSGTAGDPIRYTDGVTWTNFAPTVNVGGTVLAQCLCLLPYRGRLIAFNTLEGANLATSQPFPQRIRWSAIGDPLLADAWRDDIRGKGGFLNIPTSQSIVSVGFVRDNLVIYCESSTWQLRYTGRTIAPFQIERVNSELGAESTFSAVQFDTSLVGVGDKGIVECDSYKSELIDIKIPDLVFQFDNDSNGTKRVHGVRDFQKRLAFWTYPYNPDEPTGDVFPNRRLVYNYENDSWAIFTDSLTTLGTYQAISSRRWVDSDLTWESADFPWIDRPALFPSIVGGNQQGFVEYLDSKTTNDPSLYIKNITGNTTTVTVINSPNHNLETNMVIKITDIPTGTPFATSLNNKIFSIVRIDQDNFSIYKYNFVNGQFDIPQVDAPATYIGKGRISIRDNFSVVSKKFNFIEEGQCIQIGYIDILMDTTELGAISLNMYYDYNDSEPTNKSPQNVIQSTNLPDTFFNSVIPTTSPVNRQSSKTWQRVFCATRGAFLTIEWTLSNAQMVGNEQESEVQIDAQILWMRRAGTQLPIGV